MSDDLGTYQMCVCGLLRYQHTGEYRIVENRCLGFEIAPVEEVSGVIHSHQP